MSYICAFTKDFIIVGHKKIANYLYILTTSFVLYLLSCTFLIWVHSLDLGSKLQEQSPIVFELKENYHNDSLNLLIDKLKLNLKLKASDIQVVDHHKAIESSKSEIPSEWLVSGEKIFLDLLLVKLKLNKSNVVQLKQLLSNQSIIEDISFENSLTQEMNSISNRMSQMMTLVMMLILLITGLIINFMIKIYIQERMDIIQTSYDLGSSVDNIVKPFIRQSVNYALGSALLAIGFLSISILLLRYVAPWLYELIELKKYFVVILVLLILAPTLQYLLIKSQIYKLLKN